MIQGCITAVITPMKSNGSIDYKEYRRLLDLQHAAGVRGIVVCGTTGEAPTVEPREWDKMVAVSVKHFGKLDGAYVIANTGTNNTLHSVNRTKTAMDIGADAALVVVPYYNKPNPSGLLEHFEAVAGAGKIIIYDIPGRTSRAITDAEFDQIIECSQNVVGIKAASGDIDQIRGLIKKYASDKFYRKHDRRVYVWSGDDKLTLPVRAVGGDGVISVVSNFAPGMVQELSTTSNAERAAELNIANLKLAAGAFSETNPAPIKHMMAHAGMIKSNYVRLPMGQLSDQNKQLVQQIADEYLARGK